MSKATVSFAATTLLLAAIAAPAHGQTPATVFEGSRLITGDGGPAISAELGYPSGHSVHLDAGQRQLARKRFRREGEEEARSAAGLEHAPS